MGPTDRLVHCIRERRFEDALTAWDDLGPARFGDPFLVELGANIYGNLARFDDEIELWRRLFGMLPAESRVARSFADALWSTGRVEEASEVLRQFVAHHPDGEAFCLLGRFLLRRGLVLEALGAVGEARQLDPENPLIAAMHAQLLARNGHFGYARAIATAVEALEPTDNLTCREIGKTWRCLREFDRAIPWFIKALEADNGDQESMVALAATCEQNRDPVTARGMAEAALQQDPEFDSMHRLMLRLDRVEGNLDQVRSRAEWLLARNDSDEAQRGILLEWALAEQRANHPQKAFRLAERGNQAARTSFLQRGLTLHGFTDLVDRVLDYTPRITAPARTNPRAAPVFLVGVPRSGTTLTQQMLQAHPAIETLDELESAPRMLRDLTATWDHPVADYPHVLETLAEGDWRELRRLYWEDLKTAGVPEAPVVVDKLPLYLIRMHYLSQLFPDAKMICVIRDPRDCVWSNFLQDYEPNPFSTTATDLGQLTRLVDGTMRLWHKWRDDPPLPAVEVRYESLVADPEPTMRAVLDHLGLPWNDAVLRHHEGAAHRGIRTPSYHDVSQPVYQQAVGRWQEVKAELSPHLDRLDEMVEAFGYTPTHEPEPQLVAK